MTADSRSPQPVPSHGVSGPANPDALDSDDHLAHILFVDDEEDLRLAAADWLGLSGFRVTTAEGMQAALAAFQADPPDVVVSDIRMPGGDGLSLLSQIKELDRAVPVVLLTGHGDVTMAVDAMRRGALDFLEKPYDADHLVQVLTKATERRRLMREVERLRALVDGTPELAARIVGSSPAMDAVRGQIRQLADFNVDVLLHGDTGTGKEVVARALHDFGDRASAPFVAINCAAIPEQVFEAEMFGHAKGAFTGAAEARVGKLERITVFTSLKKEFNRYYYGIMERKVVSLTNSSVS